MRDTTTPKRFYCYADDVRKGVTVIATTHSQARMIAATDLRCAAEYVIARYQVTLVGKGMR